MASLNVRKSGNGIILTYDKLQIGLDTAVPNGPTLLSHAHSDHTQTLREAELIIATEETRDTFLARGGQIWCEMKSIDHGVPIFFRNMKITSLNAGHVLGSSMFLLELKTGQKILYTGDFNIADSIVHSGAKSIEADVLIMEATYGTEEWIFPAREKIHQDIINRAKLIIEHGRIPCFLAYSLGKAQEAIALLQREGFNVVTGNHIIDRVNQVYIKYGQELQYRPIKSVGTDDLLVDDTTIVTSSAQHMFHNLVRKAGMKTAREVERKVVDCNLSGWVLSDYGKSGFPLSAHSDFQGLVQFVKEVNPKVVYCFTSNARNLCHILSQKGYAAIPLE